MPSAQIKLDDGHKALEGVIICGHWEEGFGMRHEARNLSALSNINSPADFQSCHTL